MSEIQIPGGAKAFTLEQKEYLAGFFAGMNQRVDLPFVGRTAAGQYTSHPERAETDLLEGETVYGTPIEDLSKEEKIKHELNGLDCYDRIIASSQRNEMPEGGDIFRFKFYGLFNVNPAQDGFMLRCRIPAGILQAHQLEGLAEIAEDWAGGYADVTTRANIQLRQIQPKYAIDVLEKLNYMGLSSRGAGADNLRNITASPTAGFDRQEIYDVRALAKAMNHLILNTRELYGLPRKFNISFDGGGAISVCADTNDIGFYAVRVGEGKKVEPGVYFRVQLAGITGHKQFAKDSGILLRPDQCLSVAVAMIRVFIENGDRTNRKKARLKYVIDKWGIERFIQESDKKLDFALTRMPLSHCEQRTPIERHGYLGMHAQRQEGLSYAGVSVPVGRLLPNQMKGLAELSRLYGQSEIRLTVWQNLLIPHVRNEDLDAVREGLLEIGLDCKSDSIRGGLVACTGNTGCKFAACNTKGQAIQLGDYLSERVHLDQPINIHLTGCPHSCAQHYVGDIGLQAVKVKVGEESVEGYNIVLGGGVDDEQGLAQEVFKGVPFEEVKPLLKRVLEAYLENRESSESFIAFNRRHSVESLQEIYGAQAIAS